MEPKPAWEAIKERVFSFTAIQSHVDRDKLTPMTRLAQDLDIRGDDASEFFDAFSREFQANLDALNMNWDRHFHPEAGAVLNTIFWIVGGLGLAVFTLRPFYAIYWSSSNEWQIGSGLVAVLSMFAAWFRNRWTEPITIADLIDAAEVGRWAKSYRGAKVP